MLVRELGFDRRTALWALAFFGIGSPAFVYAGADFAQPLTAACVVYSIERGHHYRATDSRAALIGCAISIGYAVLPRPLEASLLLPFAAVACIGYPDRKIQLSEVRTIFVALGSVFALAVGLTLMVNALRYGAPFHNEYASLGARFVVPTRESWGYSRVGRGGWLGRFRRFGWCRLGCATCGGWKTGGRELARWAASRLFYYS